MDTHTKIHPITLPPKALIIADFVNCIVIQEADGLLGSAAWIGNQDWQSVLRDLETLGTKIDLSASIFR